MVSDEFRKRTFEFGILCVRLVETLPKTMTAQTIGKQLLRAGRSVGGNYRAAARGRSRADFLSRMGIVEEECDESLHWIGVLAELGLVSQKRVEKITQGSKRDNCNRSFLDQDGQKEF